MLDTIPPLIDTYYIREDSLLVKFNEPILTNKNLDLFYYIDNDSNNVVIEYDYLNPVLLYLDNKDKPEIVNIHCNAITDLMLNPLCDSLFFITDIPSNDEDNTYYGQINGDIIYNGNNNLIIEAKNLDTQKSISQKVFNNKFIFDKLIQGNYRIFVYEDINPVGESYFSGTLEPVKYSAKFSIYHKDIYVRQNWSNSIILELK